MSYKDKNSHRKIKVGITITGKSDTLLFSSLLNLLYHLYK